MGSHVRRGQGFGTALPQIVNDRSLSSIYADIGLQTLLNFRGKSTNQSHFDFPCFQKGHVTTPKAMQSHVTIACLASRDTLCRAA